MASSHTEERPYQHGAGSSIQGTAGTWHNHGGSREQSTLPCCHPSAQWPPQPALPLSPQDTPTFWPQHLTLRCTCLPSLLPALPRLPPLPDWNLEDLLHTGINPFSPCQQHHSTFLRAAPVPAVRLLPDSDGKEGVPGPWPVLPAGTALQGTAQGGRWH